MTSEELECITTLDKQVIIIHPATSEIVGSLSLCMVLLNYLKMQDGHPIIAEVHQEDYCKPAYVIIPQADEAELMIGMMHKSYQPSSSISSLMLVLPMTLLKSSSGKPVRLP